MKSNDKTVKKILLSLVLIILCLSSLKISFASETILNTTVPSYFTLQIEINGHGNVETMGQEFTESGNIRIERNKPVELIFTPDENYNIAKVQFNDKDITDNLQDNRFTIDELEKDSVLSVVFAEKQESGISKTGDSTEQVYPYIALAVLMCAIGGLLLMKRKAE
jgi:LPXTG-motif cell wall-anchored protein